MTRGLLILFAAGLVAHGIHEFNEPGWVPPIIQHVRDLNPVLDEGSGVGQLLTALLGHGGNPSLTKMGTYVGYWVVTPLALWWAQGQTELVPAPSEK